MTLKVIRCEPEHKVVRLRPVARRDDPATSQAAGQAMTVEVKGKVRQALWWLVQTLPPSTDEQMWEAYEMLLIDEQVPKATDARLRHCRGDLVQMGLMRDTGVKGTTRSGYEATVWGLT